MKIPTFVILRDRVKMLPNLIKWFEKSGREKIILCNNDSTFPPLLEYLKKTKHDLYNFTDNHAKWAPWKHGLVDKYDAPYFTIVDPDMIPPKKLPMDATDFMIKALKDKKYEQYHAAGPSYEIGNLPDHYAGKKLVIAWESRFWEKPLYGTKKTCDFFDAPIDSMWVTFRRGGEIDSERPAIRANYPYVVEHETWYKDLSKPSKEDVWYRDRCDHNRAHWIREDKEASQEELDSLRYK